MVSQYKLAIIGFGNVGQGLAKILVEKHSLLKERFGMDIQVVAVCDLRKGCVAKSSGLDLQMLLDSIKNNGNLAAVSAPQKNWTAEQTIANSDADILVELSYSDFKTGEPALSHIKQALQGGMHVSTTNKGPVASRLPELREMAATKGKHLGIEGTVMSGTPAVTLGAEMLLAAGITRIQGILNGTTNYILGEMTSGAAYQAALSRAQALGYAEADPTGDVEGHDAAAKVVILSNLLLGLSIELADVDCTGISHLTADDIKKAKEQNLQWKLMGTAEKNANGFVATVKPEMLSTDHPLSSITGATNAITYTTELLGDVTLVGPGAGRMETGYAVIEDILSIHKSRRS
jgi:homoserine dehydrogenase